MLPGTHKDSFCIMMVYVGHSLAQKLKKKKKMGVTT